jgi:hypothetical protein
MNGVRTLYGVIQSTVIHFHIFTSACSVSSIWIVQLGWVLDSDAQPV